MAVVRCVNLHTYQSEKYSECPYCKKMEKYFSDRKTELKARGLDELYDDEERYSFKRKRLSLKKKAVRKNAEDKIPAMRGMSAQYGTFDEMISPVMAAFGILAGFVMRLMKRKEK